MRIGVSQPPCQQGMTATADTTCAICLEPLAGATATQHTHATTSCNHSFCHSCLAEWLVSHNRCPVCRRNLGDPDDVQEEMDADEVEDGSSRVCHVVLALARFNTFRPDLVDQDRMHDWGTELALGIREDAWDMRWRKRKDEWTLKLRGVGRRHYLIRADVLERDGPKMLPHVVYMEPFLLQESDPMRSVGSGKHTRQRWRAHTQPNHQVRRRSRLMQPASKNQFRR